METRAHYVAVGAFVLIVIFAAFGAVLWLGRVEFGEQLKTYYIFFKGSVAGLTRGSAVQYNGIPVGRVSEIRVDRDNLSQVQVQVEINSNLVEIKTDARAFLDANILSGVAIIQIRGGTQHAPVLEPQPNHHYAIIKAGQNELEEVKASLPELLSSLKQVSQNLNSLLDERNRQAVADSLQNLRTITAAVADHSEEVGAILDHADASILEFKSLIHNIDESYTVRGGLKDQVSQTLKDYDRVAANLVDTAQQLRLILAENRSGLRDFVQTTLPAFDDLVTDARRLAQNANQFIVQLQRDPTRLLFGDRRQGYQPR
ncbi:MAG: MCE family protein [Alphaproteobacteria bacterium]|nr:MCE family protein [Alphaproteobacteria bacterium]